MAYKSAYVIQSICNTAMSSLYYKSMIRYLQWPLEASQKNLIDYFRWQQAGSNLCLDFHGNPATAKLVVYSDGNHHMALEACCQAFVETHPEVTDIFYATTPPNVIYQSLLQGGLMIGNLQLNVLPHVFISPTNIVNKLVDQNLMSSHQVFAKSRGNVLLVKKGNPKNILGIGDLLRSEIKLTMSNPVTESASYKVYRDTLLGTARTQNLNEAMFARLVDKGSTQVIFGESIHHREVPQAIYSGQADVAVVYYHLALRYTRIFPDDFELIEFETAENVYTNYHIGLIHDGGEWGQSFIDFMLSSTAGRLYQQHGLDS